MSSNSSKIIVQDVGFGNFLALMKPVEPSVSIKIGSGNLLAKVVLPIPSTP